MDDYPGPIYEDVFFRIGIMEELINVIKLAAIDFGWDENDLLEVELLDTEELREMIDPKDPKGWLQECIHEEETRLAELVTRLIEEDSSRLELIESAAYSLGEHYRAEGPEDCVTAWNRISRCLLDDMPDKNVIRLLSNSPDHVEWIYEVDVHSVFWEEAGGEDAYFYMLREKLIEGMLSESGVQLFREERLHYHLQPLNCV